MSRAAGRHVPQNLRAGRPGSLGSWRTAQAPAATPPVGESGLEASPGARLIAALRDPARYAEHPGRVDLIETHISWILLAGHTAYKIKKPVNLGFLDFTSLAARRFFCEEELRLNRRTAPALYKDVVPITGSPVDPVLDGPGDPIEYVVRMRRFPQDALLDSMARNDALTPECVDALGLRIARFHDALAPAGAQVAGGSPAEVRLDAMQNFAQIAALAGAGESDGTLDALRAWTIAAHAGLAGVFEARKRDGFVRECHGDLHLGNIVMLEGEPVPFDCIEFNPAFRRIDVMNEIAFLVMDLQEHRLAHLAFRFLNRYLEAGGDYAGLRVLRFYIVYRALVRAKIARIRGAQPGADAAARARSEEDYARYLAVAQEAAGSARGALVIMHGLSGSGKTTVAGQLAEDLQLVRLRSDVERKRLHGLGPQARTGSEPAGGIYTAAETERTYARLAGLARQAIAAGYPVIVDAAFLDPGQRERFRRLAAETGVPFAIVACTASAEELRRRVAQRAADGNDASEAGLAVLERQLVNCAPLAQSETGDLVEIAARDADALPPAVLGALTRRLRLPEC